jgi:hypothetical protein
METLAMDLLASAPPVGAHTEAAELDEATIQLGIVRQGDR